MFTGLIDAVGTIKAIQPRRDYLVLTVASSYETKDMELGESVAVDGACLTVVDLAESVFKVEASAETRSKTILGSYRSGKKVNLERALQAGGRLGGHFVLGHVDTRGTVDVFRRAGDSWTLAIKYDAQFDRLVIDKGSIAVNGVSLTVNEVESGWCTINLIPHTVEHTSLKLLGNGEAVNLEFDMIGKYIARQAGFSAPQGLTLEKLKKNGW